MPVNSAQELHDLVLSLSQQFKDIHEVAANRLWVEADAHLEHVLQQGAPWIGAEIGELLQDWQSHKRGIQEAEHWFAHHSGMLPKIADDSLELARNEFPGGSIVGSTAIGAGVFGALLAGRVRVMGEVADIGGHIIDLSKNSKTWARALTASKVKSWATFAKKSSSVARKQEEGIAKLYKDSGLSKIIKGAPPVEKAGHFLGKISNLANAYGIVKDIEKRDPWGLLHDTSQVVAGEIKKSPVPLTHLIGSDISLWSDVVDEAKNVDFSWKGMRDTWQGLHDPGAGKILVDSISGGLVKGIGDLL